MLLENIQHRKMCVTHRVGKLELVVYHRHHQANRSTHTNAYVDSTTKSPELSSSME